MAQFKNITIVDLDVSRSQNLSDERADVHFILSDKPDTEWWMWVKDAFATTYTNAQIERTAKSIIVTGPFDAIRPMKVRLDQLIKEANARRRKSLSEKRKQEAEQRRQHERGKKRLTKLRDELFN